MTDDTMAGNAPADTSATSTTIPDAGASHAPAAGAASTGESAAPSAREAIDRAFEKAGLSAEPGAAGKPAGAAKPAGVPETAGAEKTNPGAAAAGARADGRLPNGQFAPRKVGESPAAAAAGAAEAKPAGQAEQKPDAAAASAAAPPGGWSVASKAEWDKLPPHVRADIAKREAEVSAGFREFEGLKPFAARARQSGQSLAQALGAYTGIEELVRKDFAGGVMHIAQNAGLTQHEAATTFAKIAMRLGFQFQAPPAQPGGGSPADQNTGADPNTLRELLGPVLAPLERQVTELATARQREAEGLKTQRLTASQQVVETFKQDPEHKFYANLEDTIGDLLENGMVPRSGDLKADLKAAYDAACRMHPEISELLLKERVAAEAGKREQEALSAKAGLSITGAPGTGAGSGAGKPAPTARAALDNAFAQVGLG